MAACGHCGGCCAACGAVCGGCGGVSAAGLASTFGAGLRLGHVGYRVGFPSAPEDPRHEDVPDSSSFDTPEWKQVNGEALSDPGHPEHREAVTAIAHSGDHESFLTRLREKL